MKIILDTHQTIELINPEYRVETLDNAEVQTFTPIIYFKTERNGVPFEIAHSMPPQPYVNNTWTDTDVENAVKTYLQTINTENP
jgi:hypothetical protein